MKYFKGKISQGFVSIYTGRMVLMVASGLLGLFVPIFLYELFGLDIKYVFYYYIIAHFLYASSVAYVCKYLNKIGLRRSLRVSIIWGALYYFLFYLIDLFSQHKLFSGDHNILIIFLTLNIIFLTLNRIMYWIPLHTDIAKFTDKKNRGKEMSIMQATSVFLQAVLPLVAGVILARYKYDVLFLIGIIVYLSSLIPFTTLPRTKERFSWTYFQTWKEFLSKERRREVFAYMGDGAENVVGVMIWPIFIWELLQGNYFEVGALTSLIVVVTVSLNLFIGKYTDGKNRNTILKYGTCFYSIGWIFKIFVATAFQIFITSTYHNLTKIFTRTPFDTMYFENAADQGHYVDEYTVLHEMAIHYGKVIMLLIAFVLTLFFNIQLTFILAALASLAMSLLASEDLITRRKKLS